MLYTDILTLILQLASTVRLHSSKSWTFTNIISLVKKKKKALNVVSVMRRETVE